MSATGSNLTLNSRRLSWLQGAVQYTTHVLTGYFPVYKQGDSYIFFDLRHPLKPLPGK